jgi:hypothetical protein
MSVRLYRNPHCAKCARMPKVHHALDWPFFLSLLHLPALRRYVEREVRGCGPASCD